MKVDNKWLKLTITGAVGMISGVICIVAALFCPKPEAVGAEYPHIPSVLRDLRQFTRRRPVQ